MTLSSVRREIAARAVVDVCVVLCEDDRTVMAYVEFADDTTLVRSFDWPAPFDEKAILAALMASEVLH